MEKKNYYINRLIECGYTDSAAIDVYCDFVNNFTIAELEVYVKSVEIDTYVDLL